MTASDIGRFSFGEIASAVPWKVDVLRTVLDETGIEVALPRATSVDLDPELAKRPLREVLDEIRSVRYPD